MGYSFCTQIKWDAAFTCYPIYMYLYKFIYPINKTHNIYVLYPNNLKCTQYKENRFIDRFV